MAFSLSAEGCIAAAAILHVLVEAVELLVRRGEIAALHARAESASTWSRSFCLRLERNLPAAAASFGVALLSFCCFQVAAISSFSRLEMSVWLFCCRHRLLRPRRRLLRLRELALKRIRPG